MRFCGHYTQNILHSKKTANEDGITHWWFFTKLDFYSIFINIAAELHNKQNSYSHHTLQISFFRDSRLHISAQVLNWSSQQHRYTNQLNKAIMLHSPKISYKSRMILDIFTNFESLACTAPRLPPRKLFLFWSISEILDF